MHRNWLCFGAPLALWTTTLVACGSDGGGATPGTDTTTGTANATATGGSTTGTNTTGGTTLTSTSSSVTSGTTSGTTTGATGSTGQATSTTGSGGATTTGTAESTGTTLGSTTTGASGSTSTGTGSTTTGGGAGNAVLVDDFESVAAGGPPDPALWQLRVPSGDNAIEVTTEQAYAGSQSVKVTGVSGSTLFFTENVFPLPSGVVHFRVWMRFTEADWANHNAFVAASPGQESEEVRFGGQANAYHANLAADGDGLSPDPFFMCTRCVAPIADQWQCLRGKLDFANNAAELYVGEALAVDSAADGWHSGTGMFPQNPTQIGFGWALYGALPNTVYFDDLAIGYEPIDCN